MEDAPGIEVLLATYNGERFLREQIDSILSQDYPGVTVLARDDGSSDTTPEILQEYAHHSPERFRVMLASCRNSGVIANFLALMNASTADYVCFSDQDDVWFPDKLRKTQAVMHGLEQKWGNRTPLLAFTDLRIVDEKLAILYPSFWDYMGIDPDRIHHPVQALGRGIVTGCTILMNRRLLELALRMPRGSDLHDRWIAVLASTMGKSGALREQTVLYRQHQANAVGLGKGTPAVSLIDRLRRSPQNAREHLEEWLASQARASTLLEVYGQELTEDVRKEVNAFRRCELHQSRVFRVFTFITRRFYPSGIVAKLAILSHLWLRK